MAAPNLLVPVTAAPSVLLSAEIPAAETAMYTAGPSDAVKIATAMLCNISGVTVNVSVGIVPSGGSAAASHHVLHTYALVAGASLPLNDYLAGVWLGAGDFISGLTNAASSIVLTITGTVFS